MATLVSSQLQSLFPPSPRVGGILLNPTNSHPPSPALSPYNLSSSPASSSSSSDSSTDELSSPPSNLPHHSKSCSFSEHRKIRFAPLPDPRKLDEKDDAPLKGYILTPAPDANQLKSPSSAYSSSTEVLGFVNIEYLDSKSGNPDIASPPYSKTASTPNTPTKQNKRTPTKKLWSTKGLLRPLLRMPKEKEDPSTASTLTPGLGLFRTSSRDSTHSLTGIQNFGDSGGPGLGAPLSRSMTSPESRSAAAASNGQGQGSVRKGTRMLNGRVYGSKERHTIPFAHGQYVEPEFVEWGYGGMGSVAATRSSSAGTAVDQKYKNLQSARRVTIGTTEHHTGEEEDDGSGMGWVKRRREARERSKREEEERRKEAELDTPRIAIMPASPTIEQHPKYEVHSPVAMERTDSTATVQQTPILPSLPHVSSHTSSVRRESLEEREDRERDEEHHMTTAVTIPALHHAHSHDHIVGHEQDGSLLSSEERSGADDIEEDRRQSEEDESDTVSQSSEDEDDVDEDDSKLRVTSKCAGVEKISRHKD